MKSAGYGKRLIMTPRKRLDRDKWRGGARRLSRPAPPHFAKKRTGASWDFWRNLWSRPQWRRFMRRGAMGFNKPGYATLKERETWLKQYGLRRKLLNAANSTEIRREVRQAAALQKGGAQRRKRSRL